MNFGFQIIVMSRQSPDDIYETKCWSWSVIVNPYKVIAEVLETAELVYFRKFIKKILQFSEMDTCYQEKSPSGVLFYLRNILSLLMAAKDVSENQSSLIWCNENDALDGNHFCSRLISSTLWNDFPRFLTFEEYCNPYKALQAFFNYQDVYTWVHDLEEIVDCALSRNKGELGLDIISIYTYLIKLVEAAHLINVRELNQNRRTSKGHFKHD